jgi:parallel beta-helix repeat protein
MRQKRFCTASVMLALTLALLPFAASPAEAATYTVTMTSDRNTPGLCPVLNCSLREAITNANNNPGPDTINFNISGCGGVCTLAIDHTAYGPLPALTGGDTIIDGTTAPDTIEINCTNSTSAACLRINSANNTIKGLVINRCPWAGVLISGTAADHNQVLGCYIGTDATGESGSGNNGSGVVITGGADNNKIGDLGNGNVISANYGDGVWIYGEGTDDNSVAYNYIGTDKDGEADLGNDNNGIYISNHADSNDIGSIAGGRNVISSNNGDGIRISNADGNCIVGNYIGTQKDGENPSGNGGSGVWIFNGAQRNIVGGSIMEERNVISGNEEYGVHIDGADNNTVSGNYIGTNKGGGSALGNRYAGVLIANGSTNNTIGGDTEAKKNVISGNGTVDPWDGVEISNSNANTVQGNYIGLGANGDVAVANSDDGVSVSGDGNVVKDNVISGNTDDGLYIINGPNTQVTGNTIGLHKEGGSPVPNEGCGIRIDSGGGIVIGQAGGDHNTIAGNKEHGIFIAPTTGTISGTVIMGNYIGTNPSHWSWVGNDGAGVYLYGQVQYSIIGGDEAGEENVISGNKGSGVVIEGDTAHHNTVSRNYIGLNSDGSSKLPNSQNGVDIRVGASYNTVGGGGTNKRNYIGGNNYGVAIYTHSGSYRPHDNQVVDNYIGTNRTGTASLGNTTGVGIYDNARYNTVADNLISGNTQYGVYIFSSDAYGNVVRGNYIGTKAGGTESLANSESGVYIGGSARDNRIGGTTVTEGNIISGNSGYGIWITGSSTRSNDVWGNTIGTNAGGADLGNTLHGIYLTGGAHTNGIGPGNIIAFNDGDGVHVDGSTTLYNTITATQIYSNTLLGIENINGGNTELPPPTITGTSPITGTACANCVVQIFSDYDDEGRIYHGFTTADATGNFAYSGSVSGPYITATATDGSGSTSEFSSAVAGGGGGPGSGDVYLPIITKNYP